jgi:hypothetical protein
MVLACAAVSGCGGDGRPSLVKVKGKVVLNGEPVEGAIVAFQFVADAKSKYQRPSSGITDAAGEFVLGTYAKDDGAPVGKYKVGIVKREVAGGKLPENYNSEAPDALNLKFLWVVPRQYADPGSSGLEAEIVSSGLKPDTFDLKSTGKPEVELSGPQRRANDP